MIPDPRYRFYKPKGFFPSIISAMIAGIVISIVLISGSKILSHKSVAKETLVSDASNVDLFEEPFLEESEEDPTFISRFSRGFVYTALKDEEIIKSVSFPKIAITKNISAKNYGVMSLDRDTTLLLKDSERLVPIASITKLVTAVVSKNVFKKNKQIEITTSILATEGNTGKLRLGEKIKTDELLYPLLMVSSNDAAEALAQNYGREKFIKEMNNWVNSIGAYNTYFTDPSGLSKQNLSTVKDLSIITKWILENEPEIFDITSTKEKSIHFHTWINPTHLLNITSYIGGKNGYTFAAERTGLALFELGKDKHKYLVIVLGSKDRDNDTMSLLTEALR